MVRIDAQFYFGNVSFLKETLRELEAKQEARLEAVVLEASGINELDSSAESALEEIDQDYRERGIRLLFAHVKGPVRDVMYRTGLLQRLAEEQRIFLRTHDAVRSALGERVVMSAHPDRPDVREPADRIGCGTPPGSSEPPKADRVDSAPPPHHGV